MRSLADGEMRRVMMDEETLRMSDEERTRFALLNHFAQAGEAGAREEQGRLLRDARTSDAITKHLMWGRSQVQELRAEAVAVGLGHAHADVRLFAVHLVTHWQLEELLPQVAGFLGVYTEGLEVGVRGAFLACACQRDELLQPLVEALEGYRLMDALYCLHYPNALASTLGPLLRIVDGGDRDAKAVAGITLGFRTDQERLIPEMRKRLQGSAELTALHVLSHLHSVQDLRPYLEHPDTRLRKIAVEGLIEAGSPEDQAALHDLWQKLSPPP